MKTVTDTASHPALRVAVIGVERRAPDLARNFAMSPDWELVAICDVDRSRAELLARETGNPAVVASVDDLIAEHDIDAVAIATPAHTHHEMAMQAISAGKHVLLEQPLADATGAGVEMVAAAESRGTVLMAAHTECYTPAVLKIRELIAAGELGEILYLDAVRINLGFVQSGPDVFWDLAPHDLSVLDFILPGGLDPQFVSAQGADPLRSGKACVGYLTLPLSNGALAHIHVNWLSPTKVQQMVIGGSRKTLIWDDLNPQQRLSVFDRAVDPDRSDGGLDDAGQGAANSYLLEDAWSPSLGNSRPFALMVSSFAATIRGNQPAPTDGRAALRVLSVLEAATASLEHGGAKTTIPDAWAGAHALGTTARLGSVPGVYSPAGRGALR
ncbi:MAG: Gfo/Idh/MocA family oxidoreductase [Micrococcus sp.]|nr:Gfo/Idh/MocA family oxidoreductase [Micrococcus sp.]